MNKRDEQLSALLDDALTKEELSDFLHDLHQNPIEDAEKSLRYKLMGDVIRDDVEASSFMDVSASVHRAIEADNSLEQVNIKPRDSKTGFNLSSWLRPVSGMAIAASVAMVTVVTFRTADETGSVDPANQLATNSTTQQQYIQASDVAPVNANLSRQTRVVSLNDKQQGSALRVKQLNEYMLDHSGYAGQTTMQGMMPYVRVVSYEAKTNQ